MKRIRTVLVDDEPIGRLRLRRMLAKEEEIEIVAECGDGTEAIELLRKDRPDLLFLDINMPGADGFDVLEALGPDQQPPVVVFVTAYDEHAVRAFEACALDYLLKPAASERLAKTLGRVREQLAARERAAGEDTPAAEETASASPAIKRFTVRSGYQIRFVGPGEIDWVEAAGNYMILHAGTHNHMIRETMAGMETQLSGENFLRVSRSAMVNLHRVKTLESTGSGEHAAILMDGQRVNITRPLREVSERLESLA